jgi:hypothetical protein
VSKRDAIVWLGTFNARPIAIATAMTATTGVTHSEHINQHVRIEQARCDAALSAPVRGAADAVGVSCHSIQHAAQASRSMACGLLAGSAREGCFSRKKNIRYAFGKSCSSNRFAQHADVLRGSGLAAQGRVVLQSLSVRS